ncbi:GntR family transcriptional regulator [Halolactibacillus miurensis]|uniref:GntR family transcriptional regulator n=1 Tax=Halolactibacillus miurensis TaxID=306541 RepID=A0A1I6P0S9_9BACI|nr:MULTISPECIES: GntR family transcriptional regulator [Halolactibacillus]GEM03199.1 GntR family transcriptional regulator [Halolactibacillus miurensis]SFS33773.1 GntR family transcriptional regulator [Halolactibacillus miurensis]
MINDKKSQPLYAQIANDLRENIRTEKWTEGQRIPTEMDLCDMYHVSRITIRKAVEELVRENLLVRKKAKGTFVNHYSPEKTNHMTMIKSFTREMREQGKVASTIHAEVKKVTADYQVAKYLKINPGEEVLMLKRIRGSDKDFLAYFVTYVPYQAYFSLESKDYYGSFYEYLNSFNIFPTQQVEYVEAILSNKEIQTLLKLTKPEPILKRVRFTTDLTNGFSEYTECYYVGKKYKYYLDFSTN